MSEKTVTKIAICQRDKTRSNLFIDGEFYCSLDNFTVVKNKLKEGVVLTDERLEEIREEGEFAGAFDKALAYVSKYKKTKKQVREYLEGKGFSYPAAFHAVDKLASYGYLSDEEFASSYAKTYAKNKGKRLIERELIHKGVSESQAAEAVKDLDEESAAKECAVKFMRGKDAYDIKTLSKCYRHLLSKGYGYDAVSGAISFVKNGEEFEE